METKQCTGCNETKHIVEYKFRPDRGNYYTKCKKCMNMVNNLNYHRRMEMDTEFRKKAVKNAIKMHKQRMLKDVEYALAYNKKGIERIKKWEKENSHKIALISKNKQKRARKELLNHYVAQQITRNCLELTNKEIPQELIELKRNQLKLHRDVKREESKRSN
jgi:hypothetical protein